MSQDGSNHQTRATDLIRTYRIYLQHIRVITSGSSTVHGYGVESPTKSRAFPWANILFAKGVVQSLWQPLFEGLGLAAEAFGFELHA